MPVSLDMSIAGAEVTGSALFKANGPTASQLGISMGRPAFAVSGYRRFTGDR
jgi:hypothetical protein